MKVATRSVLWATLVACVASTTVVWFARAQDIDLSAIPASPGEESEPAELEAWRLAVSGRHIKAREAAERIVKRNPGSFVGHFVLGWVQHYGEANFPRALHHLNKALSLFEARHGSRPGPSQPWQWHARLLRELAGTHGDLEHHREKIQYIRRYNKLYEPDMFAEQAWPLMKMRRFEEARRVARVGLASGDPRQTEIALNAFCAIEFEAGYDGESYRACKTALDHARENGGQVNAVDITNFAEASRSLFKLDEAERLLLEATEVEVAWYGNPWLELAELYTREARFPEALNALKEVPRYRAQRPPHVRDADRTEGRRALAAFFLTIGRAADAVRITDKAVVSPDRRAHNSRDPAQDLAIVSLLDRRARLVLAEETLENAVGRSLLEQTKAFAEATWLRLSAWMSGRQAATAIADDARLVGIFRIGTADSAILPPWFGGELVDVTGPGVVAAAVRRARAKERRPLARAYYDAFEAEADLSAGENSRALRLAGRALDGLGSGEVMLRARMHAIAAMAADRLDQARAAAVHYDAAFQRDPGIFRRLGYELPVRISRKGGPVAEEVEDLLRSSPRLDAGDRGLTIAIEADAAGGRACLLGVSREVLGCGEERVHAKDSVDELARRIVQSFHEKVFAPKIDLSQADANSLDGSNRIGRDGMKSLPDDL